jgi:hypothetical protein
MRYVLTVLMALLVGCGADGSAKDPALTAAAAWDGDVITVEVDTNLPDGALLNWAAFDGDDDDAAYVRGEDLAVSGGSASGSLDAPGFGDTAEVEVNFIPRYNAQPGEVASAFAPNDGASDTARVTR